MLDKCNRCPLCPAVSTGHVGGEVESWRSLGLLWSQASLSAPVFFLADVNVAFQQSAHKVLLDDDNLLPLLHLTIEYHGKEHKGLLFLPVTLEFLLVIHFPISASIPHHRNHMILAFRNQVMQYYNSVEKKREVQKSIEAKCDAQAMFLGGWVFFCHATGMVPVYLFPAPRF